MPFSFPDKIPDQIKDLPKEAQQIWISTFNNALETNNEVQSIKIAWAAVGEKFHESNGGWAANKCSYGTMTINSIETEPCYEDELFLGFALSLTKEGVMNRQFKPPDEIMKIPGLLPSDIKHALPVVTNHPDRENMTINDDELGDGFIGNIHIEKVPTKNKKREIPHVKGIDYVPKSLPDKIEKIKTGAYNGTSIGYRRILTESPGEWANEKGEMVRYDYTESNIKLLHNARLETQEPACSPVDGCGYNEKKPADMTDDELKATWVEITKGDE